MPNIHVTTNRSDPDNVVEFERLIELAEPLGTVSCATTAAFIERQFQLAQQVGDLLARRDVAHARTGAQGCLIEVVKCGKPARKEFAVDHAFGETIDRPEAKPERQILEAVG